MAESHQPGTHSSKHSLEKNDHTVCEDGARTYLQKLAQSPLLVNISEALGDEAELHIVGGIVRDALLGKEKTDLDIASKLSPQIAMERLAAVGFHVVETGIEHGTIVIATEDQNIELTTFRAPSSRTETRYSETIEEDLKGRDFTINAIAFNVKKLTLLDPESGIQDLKDQVLRAVGDPKQRLEEDPLRVLRALRFGPAMGFALVSKTEAALTACSDQLKEVSPERIRDELTKILCAPYATKAIEVMREQELFSIFLPEILPSIGFEQNEFHIHDVYEHTLWVIDRAEPSELLRLAALFHDLGKPDTLSVGDDGRRHFYKHEQVSEQIARAVMKRLRYPKKLTNQVATIVKHHMRPMDCGPSGLRRLMRDLDDLFDEWLKFKRADSPPVMSQEEFEAMYENFLKMHAEEKARTALPEYGSLAVNGNDLIELGIPAGKKIGEALSALEEVVIEKPEKNTKDILLELAREMIQ